VCWVGLYCVISMGYRIVKEEQLLTMGTSGDLPSLHRLRALSLPLAPVAPAPARVARVGAYKEDEDEDEEPTKPNVVYVERPRPSPFCAPCTIVYDYPLISALVCPFLCCLLWPIGSVVRNQ